MPKWKKLNSGILIQLGNNMKKKEPNLNVELFWSVFKVMAALIVFVIIVFGGLLLHYINKTTTLTTHSIEMTQDGQDNNQSLTNG